MRVPLFVLVAVGALASAQPVRAEPLLPLVSLPAVGLRLDDLERLVGLEAIVAPALSLSLHSAVLDLAPPASSSPSIRVRPRDAWILEDGRPFWFAAGASSVVTLGTHILVGLPTFAVTSVAMGGVAAGAAVPLMLGVAGGYVLAQTALAALTSFLVFNSTSRVYDANWLVSFAGQIGGTVLGVGVSVLPFGTGLMLIGGLTNLAEFTGGAGLSAVSVFSLLGALPAVVIGGVALIGIPALVSAWAMCISATPKPGYAIERPGMPPAAPTAKVSATASASGAARLDDRTLPLMAWSLPGT